MTGADFLELIDSYRQSGAIPAERDGEEIGRAVTSALYGNSKIRCAKGIDEACLHEIAAILHKRYAKLDTPTLTDHMFYWLRLSDYMREHCSSPVLYTINALFHTGERWEKFRYPVYGAESFEYMRSVADHVYSWQKRDSIPFENEGCCCGLVFAEGQMVRIDVTHGGVSGSMSVELNELVQGEVPVSWRTVRKRAIPISRLEYVDVRLLPLSGRSVFPVRSSDTERVGGKKGKGGLFRVGCGVLAVLFAVGAILCYLEYGKEDAEPAGQVHPVKAGVSKKKKKASAKTEPDKPREETPAVQPPEPSSHVSGYSTVTGARALLYKSRHSAKTGQDSVGVLEEGCRVFIVSYDDGVCVIKKPGAGNELWWVRAVDIRPNARK